jgi:hypothetical protein
MNYLDSAKQVAKLTGKPVPTCLVSLLHYRDKLKRREATEDEAFEEAMAILKLSTRANPK